MKSIDTETEEYGTPELREVRPQRRSSAARQGSKPRKRPVPDPEGPSNRRAPKRRKSADSYTFISFLKDYRTHLGAGIFLCLTAIVMVICCVSFIFSNSADQSVIYGRSVGEIVSSGDVVDNAGGAVGAKLAEWLLVGSFGLGSFVLAYYIFVMGLVVMHVRKIAFFSFTFRCLFTATAISVIVGLLSYNRANLFHLGGAHGYYMNKVMLDYAGALGAYAVMVLLLGLLVAVYFNPLRTFFRMLGRVMHRKPAVTPEEEAAGAEAKDDAAASLDDLERDDDVEVQSTPADDSSDEADEAAEENTGTDHSRFMPPVGLDAFESDDSKDEAVDSDAEGGTQMRTAALSCEQGSPAVVGEVPAGEKAAGEPELIIVNKQPDEADPADSMDEIVHGDHIGIDQPYDVRASHSHYQFPPVDLLVERGKTVEINEAEQLANKKLIVDALRSYNIEIQRIEATIGPTVTLYEIVPAQGTRIAKIKSLEDDIAMSLSALGIRIIAPIPGKGTVGIEVPNRKPQIVSMRSIIESKTFTGTKMLLPMALGSTISNDIYMADLAKLPHLLVAGATGQGKSVGLNCIITSLLYSRHPDELKFVLVDPKTVEFSLFETISKQYLAKLPDEEKAVITDSKKVIDTLNSLCVEMDNRYELLSDARVKNIVEYNERFSQRRLNPEKGHRFLPYIVVIVDEYADLVMVAGKDVALPICRIAQKARAVGIHMIIATQRPSTDIITGPIKANFTARIAFKVTQGVDSKTILDRPGAQRLIGRGDMLTMMNGAVERVQCAFVDTPEVEAICEHIGNQPGFTGCYLLPDPPTEDGADSGNSGDYGAVTEEFKRCALFIASQSQASITMMQRKFEIGFNKAGRFMDQMQQMGIVGPAKGAKPRDVLMTPDEVQRLFE
ncbi:MAG: DNA translocase FtsK [Muribaculaceae bacterium]|nr:DNA translocase FtsK [Muribaculaceae bacterium]